MDENPYEAPQEKPIDRPSSLQTWRIVHWASFTGLVGVLITAILFGVFPAGLSPASFVFMLLLVALASIVVFADQKLRRGIM